MKRKAEEDFEFGIDINLETLEKIIRGEFNEEETKELTA